MGCAASTPAVQGDEDVQVKPGKVAALQSAAAKTFPGGNAPPPQPQPAANGHTVAADGSQAAQAANHADATPAEFHAQRSANSTSSQSPQQAPAASAPLPPSTSQEEVQQLPEVPASAEPAAADPGKPLQPSPPKDWVPAQPRSVGDYPGPPLFESDAERCDAICKLYGTGGGIKVPEPRFQAITDLMQSIFHVPVCNVAFIGGDHAFIKAGAYKGNVVPRPTSFCHWALVPLNPEMLIVHDTLKDGRFKDNPFCTGEIGQPLRFYAAAPLVAHDGNRFGTLCLVDYVPREFDAECCSILCSFAEIVVRNTERYTSGPASAAASASSTPRLDGPPAGCQIEEVLPPPLPRSNAGIMLCSMAEAGWPILFVDDAFNVATGLERKQDGTATFWSEFAAVSDGTQMASPLAQNGTASVTTGNEGMTVLAARNNRTFVIDFKPASRAALDEACVNVSIPMTAGMSTRASDQAPQQYFLATLRDADAAGTPFGSSQWPVSSGMSAAGASAPAAAAASDVPFPDVTVQGMLGKGSFGVVYYGTCGEESVAIKVIPHRGAVSETKAAKEELEATLGLQLQHPNIVRTYKYATHAPQQAVVSHNSLSKRGGPSRSSAAASSKPNRHQQQLTAGSAGPKNTVGTNGSVSESLATSMLRSSDVPDSVACTPAAAEAGSGAGSKRKGDKKRQLETWIVLEICDLGSLQAAIDEGAFRTDRSSVLPGRPLLSAVLSTAAEIASAIAYLHAQDILHGDLTCSNVLLKENRTDARGFTSKVSDFGLSRVHAAQAAIATNTFGTVTHMPPELLSEGELSASVDVYALGVIMWELYVSERPWAGLRPLQVILRKTQSNRRALQWPAGTPAGYKQLADACMAASWAERPDIQAVLQRLQALQLQESEGKLEAGEAFMCYEDHSKQ